MKKDKEKPKDVYDKKKQLKGGFKIIRYRWTDNGYVKSTIKKGLTLSEADEYLYKIQKQK